jgi:hypothetical protein
MSRRKISDIIRMADAHNAGVRGYDCEVGSCLTRIYADLSVPHSFSLRCRAYWSDNAYRP